MIYYCVIFCQHILLYKFYVHEIFFCVSAHLFVLLSSYPSVHIHIVMQSTGDIVQYLPMGICLHLQRYNFWEVCVVMMKLM